MRKSEKNFAYIDGANLHKGIENLGWRLNYKRFRVWLEDKYGVSQAYIFIGLVPKYKDLYTALQEAGFTLVFKEITYDGDGRVKGNCDADLVLKTTRDAYESVFNKAVLVSSDGDYAGLVKFLQEKDKFLAIISPAMPEKCSVLLKRTNARIAYLNDQKSILKA
ncbi:MAG: NYN domain-containing protein [bacterium]|nr:NYN domain-containing protein [bacterium]